MNGMDFHFDPEISAFLDEVRASGSLPHALIIESPDEKKADDLAVCLAMTAVCTGSEKPCGVCKSCQNALHKSHPDVAYPSLRQQKKQYDVEQMRELIKDAYILPNDGAAKVYIFEKADERMSPLVQNTFLKLFEEPPQNVLFILECQTAQAMLPTILSRFTVIRIRGTRELPPEALGAAREAALGLLDSREYPLLKALNALCDKDTAPLVLTALKGILRDALALLSGAEALGDKDTARQLAGRLNRKKLLDMMELCDSADLKIKQNVNSALLATWACGEFRRIIWQR